MNWYKRFGYDTNPFELNPFFTKYTLINHESVVKNIMVELFSGNLVVLKGIAGSGRTALLAQLLSRIGKKKALYIDCATLDAHVDIEQFLSNSRGVFARIFSGRPKQLMVLFDNAQHLSRKNTEKIKYFFDQNYIKGAVFAITNPSSLSFSPSFWDRVSQTIAIPPVNEFEALRIVRDRFSDQLFLSDAAILKIFSLCDQNIKKTLIASHAICAAVSKEGRGEVLAKHLSAIFRRELHDWSIFEVKHEA
jgi:hypothetical protein